MPEFDLEMKYFILWGFRVLRVGVAGHVHRSCNHSKNEILAPVESLAVSPNRRASCVSKKKAFANSDAAATIHSTLTDGVVPILAGVHVLKCLYPLGGLYQCHGRGGQAEGGGGAGRLTAKLVGFLIRDARPAHLTKCKGFRGLTHSLNPRSVLPGENKIRTFTLAMCEEARDLVIDTSTR
jgi:hypothetical protein